MAMSPSKTDVSAHLVNAIAVGEEKTDGDHPRIFLHGIHGGDEHHTPLRKAANFAVRASQRRESVW